MSETLRFAPEDTLISPSARAGEAAPPSKTATHRTTVLPRVEWNGTQPNIVPLQRERFEELGLLGQGGMGEVVLLKDHDIERQVALKRLPADSGLDRVLRFVEEIRTVGQLDHPNIVPVHDVGVDGNGRYYFVMKHLRGETLDSIIARLRAGDREAHARFSYSARVQIFLGVLNALAYAHRQGFIHRDIKPANIMVGPFGEVTVVDWGLARRVRAPSGGTAPEAVGTPPVDPREATALRTQAGSVMGTPLYMSPEQARGAHDEMDERSDIYSLCVVFHEFLSLRHYLEGRESLAEVLEGVKTVTPDVHTVHSSPHQPPMPVELEWFLSDGLAKEPARRYASVEAMTQALRDAMEGRCAIRCQRTLLKSGLHRMLRAVDNHPIAIIIGSTLVGTLLLYLVVQTLLQLLT
ncbi:serine/threonine-protein kinase [Myxococcaceae bacterium GXIMD 01537]